MTRIRCVVERITFHHVTAKFNLYRNHQSKKNAGSCRYEESRCLCCEAYHSHKTEYKAERPLEKCLIL